MIKTLSRKRDHRRSLLRNLATSLVLYEEIKTTQAKAHEVRPIVEHLITIVRKNPEGAGNLAVRRRLLGYFFDKNATKKMFEVIVPRYKNINSGFIQIIKINSRLGDNAKMAIIKLKEVKNIEEKTDKGNKNGKETSKETPKETKNSKKK